jgi:hypothetical protein
MMGASAGEASISFLLSCTKWFLVIFREILSGCIHRCIAKCSKQVISHTALQCMLTPQLLRN